MKSAKNELKQFVAGVVMLIVGLFILSQKVVVSCVAVCLWHNGAHEGITAEQLCLVVSV